MGGFRSAVAWLPSVRAWLTVGPAGSDLASDAAGIWTPAGGDGYETLRIDRRDFEATVKLLVGLVKRLDKKTVAGLV